MSRTLKSSYIEKRRVIIEQKVRESNAQLLRENTAATLIIEAMDENDLKVAGQVIDKLRTMKGKGLDPLDRAIEQAETELNKYTAGGPLTKAWTKLKGKLGIDNPLVKIMTMADALEQGFKLMPAILKNAIGSEEDLYKNSGKSIAELVPDEEKQKVILKNIIKALTPKGVFGAFKKIPYVDMSALAPALLAVDLGDLSPMIKTITSGPSAQKVAGDIKDIATAKGDAETKATGQGEPAVGSTGSAGSTPAKSTTGSMGSTEPGNTPPRDTAGSTGTRVPEDQVKEIAAKMKMKNTAAVVKFLEKLNDMGHLKS